MSNSVFDQLINTQRKTFTVTAETDEGPVELAFRYSKKSRQSILFDCGASEKTLRFAFDLADGKADFKNKPSGNELDKIESAVGEHFVRNEMVSPELTKEQANELLEKIDPCLKRDIFSQIQAKAFPDVDAGKN